MQQLLQPANLSYVLKVS